MDAYTYVNQMIDANSAITRMIFPPAVYAVVTGPVPADQPAIPQRIVCDEGDGSTDDTLVYDVDLFLCSVRVTV